MFSETFHSGKFSDSQLMNWHFSEIADLKDSHESYFKDGQFFVPRSLVMEYINDKRRDRTNFLEDIPEFNISHGDGFDCEAKTSRSYLLSQYVSQYRARLFHEQKPEQDPELDPDKTVKVRTKGDDGERPSSW